MPCHAIIGVDHRVLLTHQYTFPTLGVLYGDGRRHEHSPTPGHFGTFGTRANTRDLERRNNSWVVGFSGAGEFAVGDPFTLLTLMLPSDGAKRTRGQVPLWLVVRRPHYVKLGDGCRRGKPGGGQNFGALSQVDSRTTCGDFRAACVGWSRINPVGGLTRHSFSLSMRKIPSGERNV